MDRRAFCLSLLTLPGLACADREAPAGGTRPPRPRAARRYDEVRHRSPPEPRVVSGPFAFDRELFAVKASPEPGDWLARFRETRQSMAAYQESGPRRPTETRRIIALHPLGSFAPAEQELVSLLVPFAEAFFGLPVRLEAALPLPLRKRRSRNEEGRRWEQHLTVSMAHLLERTFPGDAVVHLGVTAADLYPDPDWNFVFGEADVPRHVGVYSLARFLPAFTGDAPEGEGTWRRALRRSFHLLAHETGHLFGLPHCVAFECLMNGTNSLDELDRQRDELCHSCLEKLAYCTGFSPLERYRDLLAWNRARGFTELSTWLERRLARLQGAG